MQPFGGAYLKAVIIPGMDEHYARKTPLKRGSVAA